MTSVVVLNCKGCLMDKPLTQKSRSEIDWCNNCYKTACRGHKVVINKKEIIQVLNTISEDTIKNLKLNRCIPYVHLPSNQREALKSINIINIEKMDDRGIFCRCTNRDTLKENGIYRLRQDFMKPACKKSRFIVVPITLDEKTGKYVLNETFESTSAKISIDMGSPNYLGCRFQNPKTKQLSSWSLTNKGCRQSNGRWYFVTQDADIPAIPVEARFFYEYYE